MIDEGVARSREGAGGSRTEDTRSGDQGRRKTRRTWGRVALAFLTFLLLVLLALGGGSWYYSQQVLDVSHGSNAFNLVILAKSRSSVTLTRSESSSRPGVFGLFWPRGHALVGPVLAISSNKVQRCLSGVTDTLSRGSRARVDGFVYSTPSDVRLSYRTVQVPDPLGPMPAWFIGGTRRTWALLVHGRGSQRAEGIRPMPRLAKLGFPVLDLSYRNDVGAPASGDHLYHLGDTEWLDVQAGVKYAITRGATSFILYGYSMGGGIVETFIHRSPYRRYVRAVVLDSPTLDWKAILDLAAQQRGLPRLLTATSKQVIAWRLGMSNLDQTDQLRVTSGDNPPTLLFHGTADTSVPIASSDAFARAHRRSVVYIRIPGAEHTQSWNTDPALVDDALGTFLTRVAGAGTSAR